MVLFESGIQFVLCATRIIQLTEIDLNYDLGG